MSLHHFALSSLASCPSVSRVDSLGLDEQRRVGMAALLLLVQTVQSLTTLLESTSLARCECQTGAQDESQGVRSIPRQQRGGERRRGRWMLGCWQGSRTGWLLP